MRIRCSVVALALGVTAVVAVPRIATADTVTLDFALTVRDTLGDLRDLFNAPVAVGDVVEGRLVYDSSTADRDPNPEFGSYRSAGSLSLAIGTGLSLPLEQVFAFDNNFSPIPGMDDGFGAFVSTEAVAGFRSVIADLNFVGGGRSGDALPRSTAEMLATFMSGGLRLLAWKDGGDPPFDRGTHELHGTVRILPEAHPVPEPATLILCASGLALVVRRARAKRSRMPF
jgi:PEP-CTERM motif-containing protein